MIDLLKTVLIILTIAVFAGCEENVISISENVLIEFGSECGWCGGTEFISVSSTKIEYTRNIPCGDEKGTIKKSKTITPDEWEEISSSFDYSLFKKLAYSECNVCVDGCDEIIKISENNNSHEIRYSPSKSIKEISDFQNILKARLTEMQEAD